MAYGFALRVWGDFACFTRPEMKVERVSYDTITPGAARNILQAIYWKPQIQWVIDRIHVLAPIRFTNVRRNELGQRLALSTVRAAMKDGTSEVAHYIEDDRQQRAGIVLRNVDYVIESHFDLDASTGDTPAKHAEMFRRRASRGQCHMQPYLGTREFSAFFTLIDEIPCSSLAGERDLGYVLYDIDFENDMTPMFFRPVMKDGVIDVPPPSSSEVVR